MQHVNLPPNLAPSPACDRPALSRALAKKPEERWPSVKSFVYGLLNGPTSGRGCRSRCRARTRTSWFDAMPSTPPGRGSEPPEPRVAQRTTRRSVGRWATETSGPVFTPAPPESTGPGPLRPALVIGLGQTGLRVLRRLRFDLAERFGQPEMLADRCRACTWTPTPRTSQAAEKPTRRGASRPLARRRDLPGEAATRLTLPQAALHRPDADGGVARSRDALSHSAEPADDGVADVRAAGVLRSLPPADGEDPLGDRHDRRGRRDDADGGVDGTSRGGPTGRGCTSSPVSAAGPAAGCSSTWRTRCRTASGGWGTMRRTWSACWWRRRPIRSSTPQQALANTTRR